MRRYLFIKIKVTNTFLAGLSFLLLASCLPAPTPANATKSSPYEELTSALMVTPDSFPNEESTSPPGDLPTPVSSTTQTLPIATSNNTPTSDLGWSSHVDWEYSSLAELNVGIAFRYPEHWKLFYIYEYDELPNIGVWTSQWLDEFYICMIELDKDIGMFFHFKWDEDHPLHLFTRWAKHGMDLNKVVIGMPDTVADSDGWNIASPNYPPSLIDDTLGGKYISRVVSFKPETVADGGNITIAGRLSSILTAHENGLTVQATYLKPEQIGKAMGMIWYAPSDQWDDIEEIFSEILASITFLDRYYFRYDREYYSLLMPPDWLLPIDHPNGEGEWFQSADQKIGMLVGMMPQGDPSRLLADWTPRKLSSLGFSNCSVPIPGEQMKSGDITADSMQGTCLDDSMMEVTYKITYIKIGDSILEVVTYFPTIQSDRAWFLSYMFESIRWEGSNPCKWDPTLSECYPE